MFAFSECFYKKIKIYSRSKLTTNIFPFKKLFTYNIIDKSILFYTSQLP